MSINENFNENNLNDQNYLFFKKKNNNKNINKKFLYLYKLIIFILYTLIILFVCFLSNKKSKHRIKKYKNKIKEYKEKSKRYKSKIKHLNNYLHKLVFKKKDNIVNYKSLQRKLENELKMPHLKMLNSKRTFEKRIPLPNEIKCNSHFKEEELFAFLSLLTKNTTYFETGSGCSSIIAKYYAKKTYAVEGCKEFYEFGIKNGLKDNIIFKDLKPDSPVWSYPGKKSDINDIKNYFQAYKKEYNADIIMIDGRFKVATAMDIFNKIRNDTIILLHEYDARPSYYVIEDYYDYIYHWRSLYAFVKKKDIKEIPIEIQKIYWDKPL